MEVEIKIMLDPEQARRTVAARNLRNLLVLMAARLLEASINHRGLNNSDQSENPTTDG